MANKDDESGRSLPPGMARTVNTMQACLYHVWSEPTVLSMLSKHLLAVAHDIEGHARQLAPDDLQRKLHALEAAQFFHEIALRTLRREAILAQRNSEVARAALDRAQAWADLQDALRPASKSG